MAGGGLPGATDEEGPGPGPGAGSGAAQALANPRRAAEAKIITRRTLARLPA
ncbi:MAG TPA: hypothetical protein PKA93_00355 [Arachnia sp.]|nr:hypothetical protein [Arachnia sp.]